MLYKLSYLFLSSQDGGLSSQTQTYGTHNTRLARAISSNDHIKMRSRYKLHSIIGSTNKMFFLGKGYLQTALNKGRASEWWVLGGETMKEDLIS